MDRPDWVPARAWRRLAAALRAQPEHAEDVLADLAALTASWDGQARERLIDRFVTHAASGVPAPAAVILSLRDLLEGDG